MDMEYREGGTNILLSLACIVIVIAGLRTASSIVVPFFLSIFIAVMCASPFSWLRSKRVPAAIAIILIIAVFIGVMFGIGAYIGASVSEFSQQLPAYQNRLKEEMVLVITWFQGYGVNISEKVIIDYFNPGSAMEIIANILSSLGSVLTNSFLILFTVVFILLEASSFSAKLIRVFGGSEATLTTIDKILESIEKYFTLKTWISLVTGIAVTVWLMILGINYALLWGLVAFLLNYIPNIGPFIAAIPTILFALVDAGLGPSSLAALGYLIIKTILGDIVEPVFMGRGLSLSMLVVFLSLVFWGWVLGPVGMLLSVPLTMIIKIGCEGFPSTRWIAMLLDSESEPAEKIEDNQAANSIFQSK
jgi:predicted PurR-regulated permease PerM